MPYNAKSKKNLKPIDNSDPEINNAKSRGQINRSIEKNIIATLRTEIQTNTTILKDLPLGIQEEVKKGKFENAIKLLNIIKEPEAQSINLNGDVGVKKVFITPQEKTETDNHINEVINGDA